MGFDSGTVSFRRFRLNGQTGEDIAEILEKLSEDALRPSEIGRPEELEFGWSGGRHILDGSFGHERNVYGETIRFALRVDRHKPPSDLKRAYMAIEMEAAQQAEKGGGGGGKLSKSQRQQIKEAVSERIDDELREGKHRRTKLIPILWHVPSGRVLSAVSRSLEVTLGEMFEKSFGLELSSLSSGNVALEWAQKHSRQRNYEDTRPTRFVLGPEGESHWPEYPWCLKGESPKDYLGNEMLLWLWHKSVSGDGTVELADKTEASVFLDAVLDLDCGYGITGRDVLKGTGVHAGPEARDAVRVGKVPRKAGLVLDWLGKQYAMTLSGENLAISGAKLPEAKDADNERAVMEHRLTCVDDLCQLVDGLMEAFLAVRFSGKWESQMQEIRKWSLEQVGRKMGVSVTLNEAGAITKTGAMV